ncbi:MAG: hypothetical protein HYY04_09455 [Chloroflexi bacterium]|nr:hypothetical protein [Chloroflexota bacterium]
MDWITSGQTCASVVVGAHASRVERAAARLLVDEVRQRTGATLPVLSEEEAHGAATGLILLGTPATHRLIARSGVQAERDPDGEAIAVQTGQIGGHPAVFAVGAGPRGALYAVDEVLDRLQVTGTDAILPPVSLAQRPSFRLRAREQHGLRLYDDPAPPLLDRYQRTMRYFARHRGNVCCLGQDWPEMNSALVGYRHFPELLDAACEPELDRKRARARELVSLAADYGIDVYLTMVELRYPPALPRLHPEIVATDPPGGKRYFAPPNWPWLRQNLPRVCTSHPTTWAWYRAKVRELFEVVPEAAGMELWISWADTDVFYCACARCRARTPAEHLHELIAQALAGMDEAAPGQDKRLILRTYLGGWRHILAEEFFAPLAGRLDRRVIVCNKAQYGDMYYGNAPHPLAGRYVPHNAEAIEFCLGGEYRAGLRWGTLAPISPFIEERVQLYADRGVDGLYQRHLDWQNHFNAPDFETFFALAWDRTASPERIWQRWAERTYGAEVGPRVVEILRDGTRVMEKAMYVRGVALGSHTLFPESLERMRHLTVNRSAKLVDGGMERIAPTRENVQRIVAEKDEAIALSHRVLARVEGLRPDLPDKHYRALHLSFNLQHELALVYRELAELFWRYLRWEHTLSEVEREFQREDLLPLLPRFRAAISRLRERVPRFWRPELFEALGTDPATWSAIDFSHGFPYGYLDQIAIDLERQLDVDPYRSRGNTRTTSCPRITRWLAPSPTRCTGSRTARSCWACSIVPIGSGKLASSPRRTSARTGSGPGRTSSSGMARFSCGCTRRAGSGTR